MANRKISQLTALTTPAAGDYLPIVDISEAADADKNKRITIEELLRGAPDGTAAAPSIAFESDPDSGLYSTGANGLALATGGTGRLFIDSNGGLQHYRSGSGAALFEASGNSTVEISRASSVSLPGSARLTASAYGRLGIESDDYITFSTGTQGASIAERLRIRSDGKLGLGTSFPDALLTVNGVGAHGLGSAAAPSFAFTGDLNTGIYSPGADQVAISTGGTGRLFIDASGRVGVGVTPSQSLHIKSTSNGTTARFENNAGNFIDFYESSGGTRLGYIGSLDNVNWIFHNDKAGSISFDTNNIERARIDSSGRLLVGTSTSIAGATLQVAGTLGGLLEISRFQAGNAGPFISTYKSRGATVGTNTAVVADDLLGGIQFHGAEGSGYQAAANIRAFVESGTISSTSMPGRLVFSTTADGASTPTERLRITSTGQIQANSLGSAAAPILSFTTDTNTGIYSPGADQIAISTGGTGRLFLDGAGRTGINTATPQNELEVFGSGNPRFAIRSPESITEGSEIGFQFGTDANSSTNTLALIRAVPTQVDPNPLKGDLLFQTNPGDSLTERLRITSDGKLGLGTSSPQKLLDISQSSGTIYDGTNTNGLSHELRLTNTNTTLNTATSLQFVGAGSAISAISSVYTGSQSSALTFATRGGSSVTPERMRIDSSGKVGIGTTAPSKALEVNSAVETDIARFTNSSGVTATIGTATGLASLDLPASTAFRIRNSSEVLRIDSSGRLLVGTSSSSASTRLVVQGNSSAATGTAIAYWQSGSAATSITSGAGIGDIAFTDNAGKRGAQISAVADANWGSNDYPTRLSFFTVADGSASVTERMRITSDAYVRLTSGTGGIQFNGDTAAANALDDYEEGTWSPVYTPTSGSFATMTMFVQSARYTKIGNLVTAEAYIVTSNVDVTGASGSVNITGLPFTSYSAQPLRRSGAIGYSAGFAAYPVYWIIQQNTTTIELYEARGDGLDVADLLTGTGSKNIIYLSVSYIAA